MKYGESTAAQRRANADNLLHLRDIADQPISIMGYEQRRSREDDRPYLILSVVQGTGPQQRIVPVATSATVVVRQVEDHFAEHPGEAVECVITKRPGREGREYWVLEDPDRYKAQRAQSRAVRYPTQQERVVRPTDVAANDDKMEDIPF
jgi:hypothetical protein